MAWRIVRQPNGLLARFSDVVDNFTHLNMTELEAVELCSNLYNMSMPDAMQKVLAGVEDWEPWTNGETKGDGTWRWKHDIATVETIHGEEAVQELLALCGLTIAEPDHL